MRPKEGKKANRRSYGTACMCAENEERKVQKQNERNAVGMRNKR